MDEYAIEVFTRGCPSCEPTVVYAKQLAGGREVRVRDVTRDREARAAMARYDIDELPAIVVDGRPLACCGG